MKTIQLLLNEVFGQIDRDPATFGQLYHLRWGVETVSGVVKTRLQLDNFSGLTAESVRPDFSTTLWITNLESVFTEEATAQLEKKTSKNRYP